jgi:hypothetical protein
VSAHIATSGSTGLFHKAFMSSSGFVDWVSAQMAVSEEVFDEALLRVGCVDVACMEAASADLLRNVSYSLSIASDPTGDVRSTGLSGGQRWGGVANPSGWGPVVDGEQRDHHASAPSPLRPLTPLRRASPNAFGPTPCWPLRMCGDAPHMYVGVELLLAPERYLLPNASALAANTSIAKVPIMIGWARDEGGVSSVVATALPHPLTLHRPRLVDS